MSAVAEHALRDGALAGLEALMNEALRLTGVAGIALHEGRVRIAEAGLRPPPPSRSRAVQALPVGDGRATLAILSERISAEQQELLTRIARLAGTLLVARRREVATQTRQLQLCQERRKLERELTYRECARSRASHDLRTPLLVIKGYLEMMRKGMAGPLSPTMERYAERMASSAQDMNTLIVQQLSRGGAPEDLLCLLTDAFEPLKKTQNISLSLECAAQSVPVRGPGPVLAQLARMLARDVSATRARAVSVKLDPQEKLGMWRLRVSTDKHRALPARKVARLEHLVLRLGGTLSIQDETPFELRVHLPAVGFTSVHR
ncbi:histidine kinase dimerization/phospho-acceptor domain-containing protein [Hyalangium gracile]|uniref:histidine kinase dimerization/phospho-acceptor domain-containing protein n=1 Tax=Hyalangium gracile TaxID=394092 RepID=UPI001CC98E61|nr:histidine kinase dimerization/phospho-acceptor domain-containing protein [Hyalangium gracile]